ncbi:MAG: hypothetical protein WC650_01815 [Candidatus Doudnabacteria bacterium]
MAQELFPQALLKADSKEFYLFKDFPLHHSPFSLGEDYEVCKLIALKESYPRPS